MKSKFVVFTLLALSVTGLAACENTFHGAGRDMERAGEAVQETVPAK